MTKVLLSIGSNQNDPKTQLIFAYDELSKRFRDVQMSSLYSTEPVGTTEKTPFINAAVTLDTDLSAPQLLASLLEIEAGAGRYRELETPNGPRNLDLDIILFGSETWLEIDLIIPHPRFDQRRFVLVPAAEIAADTKDPIYHKTIQQYLLECVDRSWVERIDKEVEAN